MSLPWVRLDTTFPTNPKLLEMLAERDGHRAAFVYLCSLAWAGGQGADGFIPRTALPFLHGKTTDATRLTEYGFWTPVQGGWEIHGWLDKQESTTETQARSARMRALAQRRWHGDKIAQMDARRNA